MLLNHIIHTIHIIFQMTDKVRLDSSKLTIKVTVVAPLLIEERRKRLEERRKQLLGDKEDDMKNLGDEMKNVIKDLGGDTRTVCRIGPKVHRVCTIPSNVFSKSQLKDLHKSMFYFLC